MEELNMIETIVTEAAENIPEITPVPVDTKVTGMTFGKAVLAGGVAYAICEGGKWLFRKLAKKPKKVKNKTKAIAEPVSNDDVFDEPIPEIEAEGEIK